MKTIKTNGLKELKGFEELKPNDKFIYQECRIEFQAIKINDQYAAFINYDGKFILAQKYKNCLSIGSGSVMEFSTFAMAKEYAKKWTPLAMEFSGDVKRIV